MLLSLCTDCKILKQMAQQWRAKALSSSAHLSASSVQTIRKQIAQQQRVRESSAYLTASSVEKLLKRIAWHEQRVRELSSAYLSASSGNFSRISKPTAALPKFLWVLFATPEKASTMVLAKAIYADGLRTWWRNLPAAEFERKRAEIILNSTSTSNNIQELAI